MRPNVKNILTILDLATPGEISAGLGWYQEAHVASDNLHIGPGVGAAVVAALSPGLRWERNIEAAQRLINRQPLDGLGVRWYNGVRKAERILSGENPSNVLKGNKVRAFWKCLVDPTNKIHVCVDGHAWCIWHNHRVGLDEVPQLNDRLYRRIASDYVLASREVDLIPCQLQAITWVAWRRIHGVANNGNGRIKKIAA